jgi:hypothetical protein
MSPASIVMMVVTLAFHFGAVWWLANRAMAAKSKE